MHPTVLGLGLGLGSELGLGLGLGLGLHICVGYNRVIPNNFHRNSRRQDLIQHRSLRSNETQLNHA